MRLSGQGLDELRVKTNPELCGLLREPGQESIVKAASAPQAPAVAGKGEARYENEIDLRRSEDGRQR